MQTPTPNRLDSVEVTNKGTAPVSVSVTYDNHKDKVELMEDHTIAPGESWHFTEKVLDMGSWTAIAPVKKVQAAHANGSSAMEPVIGGIVKKLAVHVGADGSLTQG
ncbi:hypothetical protein FOA52_012346 [Chlamydomonas sp. UWO 241]|nr:hypothetical protein FOA52_012346 [Chlamydomonas sp. UWO 241]